jgi:hypothetical protein
MQLASFVRLLEWVRVPRTQKVEVMPPGLSGLLSTGSGHFVSTSAAVLGLLYLFLVSGNTFLRKLVLVTPSLKHKKRAVEIVRNIEIDISFYLVPITAINIAIGFIVMATTTVLGIPDPFLWGTLAAVLSFAPYVGEFAIVRALALSRPDILPSTLCTASAPRMILLLLVAQFFGPTTWQKCERELFDGEGALAVEPLTLFPCHARKEAKVVLLSRLIVATSLEFTLGTMPV